MKYRLIIFDFDGTLANSLPWVMSIMNAVADKWHVRRIEDSEIETLRGFDARAFIKHMEVPLWKIPLISKDVKSMMARDIRQIPLFDDMASQLQQLSALGATLAVVSSNSDGNVRQVLGPANAALFQYYECGAAMFGKKAKFRKILNHSGIPHDEALCIGDEIRDSEAARSENIAFGAVAWGYTRLDALQAQSPAEVFMRVDEITKKIA